MQEKKLSIWNDTFKDLKNDFDKIVSNVIETMIEKQQDGTAAVNIGLKITLGSSPAQVFDPDGEERRVLVPTFEHKIASQIKISESSKGKTGGNFELVLEEGKGFVLREINGGQVSLEETMQSTTIYEIAPDGLILLPENGEQTVLEQPEGKDEFPVSDYCEGDGDENVDGLGDPPLPFPEF